MLLRLGYFFISSVDDLNPALPVRALNYGNHGIFLTMGIAGFASSTVETTIPRASRQVYGLRFESWGRQP